MANFPYESAKLDVQLDAQSKVFLAKPGKGYQLDGGNIKVSKIFDWFDDDFGGNKQGVLKFIKKYNNSLPADAKISGYLDYNWNMNIK